MICADINLLDATCNHTEAPYSAYMYRGLQEYSGVAPELVLMGPLDADGCFNELESPPVGSAFWYAVQAFDRNGQPIVACGGTP